MGKSITLSFKNRFKLIKRYQKNASSYKKEALFSIITERKERSITKMSAKLDNPETKPKTYW